MNKNLLIVLAILLFNIGYGQDLKTWTGAQSTAWDDDANWAPEGMPTFDNDILISNGPNVLYQPIISIPGITCGTLTLQNSTPGSIVVLTVKGLGGLTTASIIMNSSVATSKCSLNIGSTVTVKGDVKMNGTALQNDVTFSGDGNLLIGGMMTGGSLNTGTVSDQKGTVTYNGTTTRSVGAYSYHNLTLSGSGVRTIGSGVIVNGTLTMTGSATASAAPVYGDNAALRYNSVSNQTVGPEWVTPFVSKGGVQISTIAPKVVTIGDNLEKKFDKGVSLIIDSEASLVVGNNSNMYFAGNFMNSEGSLITDGYVYLTGTSNQNIGGFVSTKGVVMSKTAGTATFTANVKAEELTIDGIGGALNLGKNLTHTFTKWIRTQGTLNGGSSILKISGDVVGNGSNFVSGTGTVEFNGGAQNLGSGSITYNNLVLSGTGVKTFGAKTTINDTFSIATGVVADLTAGFVHTAKSIKLGGNAGSGGSWGSSLSNAVNKNNVYFTSNSGIVNVGPTIVVSTNSLPALTTIYGTPSVSKNFDITGIAMLEGIVVTPSSEFEVSTDGITFANTLTLGATGNIAQSKIYVRLKATTAAGSYSSGNIALTSNGTTTVNIPIATSTVDKAELTIKAENKEKAYGSDNPVLTVSYDGFVNGETVAILIKLPTITTTAVKGSVAGTTYPITATGAEALNYKFKYEPINGSLTITPVALTITTNDNSKVYGSQNPVLTVSYDGFVPGETEANLTAKPTIATTAVTGSPVGKYEITATGAASSNYKITYVNKGSLTITPAALTITTNDNSKVYGSQNPVLTVSYVGFVNEDTEASLAPSAKIVTSALIGSGVGTYPIIASEAVSSNYTITYDNKGLLTVTPAELKITADNKEKEHGIDNPVLTATYVGFVNGDTVTSLSMPVTIVTLAVKDSSVGKYDITVSGAKSTNYDITFVSGTLEVTKSTNAGLTDLAISEGKLSPDFAEGTKDYTAIVPNDVKTITVTPTTADTEAKVTVNGVEVPSRTPSGEITLQVGENKITTIITAQDGTINTYTVIVTREPSSNAGMTDLAISEGTLSPVFAEVTKDYTATVKNDVKDITVTPFTSDTTATITVNGKEVANGTASGNILLEVGKNEITTIITAQDGKTQETYTVVVTREPSSDAGLADITVNEGALSPVFNTDTKGYTVDVPNGTNSIIVTPTPRDPDAKVEMIVDGKTITDNAAPIDLKVGD
ncbi:hypothetical protein OA88_11795, partial [Flavobacterium sp. JRM]